MVHEEFGWPGKLGRRKLLRQLVSEKLKHNFTRYLTSMSNRNERPNGDIRYTYTWGVVGISGSQKDGEVMIIFTAADEADENEDGGFTEEAFTIGDSPNVEKLKEELDLIVSEFMLSQSGVIDGSKVQKALLDHLRALGYEVQADKFETWYATYMES